jgi:hypothetical protein
MELIAENMNVRSDKPQIFCDKGEAAQFLPENTEKLGAGPRNPAT